MTTSNLIAEVAELIADYDVKLADAFINKPFDRVNMAYAFAKGFAKNPNDDIHPVAQIVIRSALFIKEIEYA